VGVASGSGAEERPLVDVQVEIEAHLEQETALDHTRRHVGGSDGAQQDAVESPEFVERGIGQDLAVAQIPLPAQIEVGGGDVDPSGADDLDGLGRHVGSDPVPADHCDVVRHERRA